MLESIAKWDRFDERDKREKIMKIAPYIECRNWLCLDGDIHISLIYDCRVKLQQQYAFFKQFLSEFNTQSDHSNNYETGALNFNINLSLMTYGPTELVEVETLTGDNYTLDRFNEAFIVLNNSTVSCAEDKDMNDILKNASKKLEIEKNKFKKTTEELGKIKENYGKILEEFKKTADEFMKTTKEFEKTREELMEKIEKIENTTEVFEKTTEELKKKTEEFNKRMEEIKKTLEEFIKALEDLQYKYRIRQLNIFIVWEKNILNKNGRHTLRFLEDKKLYPIDMRTFFIVVTGENQIKSNNRVIYTPDLEHTMGLVMDIFYAICETCGKHSKISDEHGSCYLVGDKISSLNVHEANELCGKVWRGSQLISLDDDLEYNNFVSDISSIYFKAIDKVQNTPQAKIVWNVLTGLSKTKNSDGDHYKWIDGGPFVLEPKWTFDHINSSCLYISFDLNVFHNTWKEADCDKRINDVKLVCEKNMDLNKVVDFNKLSFKYQQKTPTLSNASFYKFLLSKIYNASLSSANLKLLPDLHMTSCQEIKSDVNKSKSLEFMCQTLRHDDVVRSNQTRNHQIYISELPVSGDYIIYELKEIDNSRMCKERFVMDKKNNDNNYNYNANAMSESEVVGISVKESMNQIVEVQKCLYDVDLKRTPLGFRNNSHLGDCDFESKENCPYCVQCSYSYYIPYYLIDDGIKDCPYGEDENTFTDDDVVCQRVFRFDPREMCVQTKIYKEVFVSRGYSFRFQCTCQCKPGFVCMSSTVTSFGSDNKTQGLFLVEANVNVYESLWSIVLTPQVYTLTPFLQLVEIDVSGCGIAHFKKIFHGLNFSEVLSLDISHNKIKTSNINEMVNLKKLNVSVNKNFMFDKPFNIPKQMEILDISDTLVSQELFEYLLLLPNLKTLELRNVEPIDLCLNTSKYLNILDFQGTEILNIKTDCLSWLSIGKALYTDDFRICCDVIRGPNITAEHCHAPRDAISTCKDLIGDPLKRVILWVVGVVSLLGNMVVLIYRLVWNRAVFKTAYGLFVVCLGLSDCIMGVYLLIIAGADLLYRNLYVLNDMYWRHSNICKLAGILSTFSSETSTMFICLITLDRFLVIRYPFGQHRFSKTGKTTSICLTLIIGVVVSVIPAVFPGWEIYSSNGMCLALPFSAGRHKGWEYSAVLFVGLNFVLFILIAFGQLAIFLVITWNNDRISSTIDNSRRAQDLAVAKQLFLVAVSDFCCWFPIGIMGIMSLNGYEFDLGVYAWSAVLILPVNSAINPSIYTLPAIYKSLKRRFNIN